MFLHPGARYLSSPCQDLTQASQARLTERCWGSGSAQKPRCEERKPARKQAQVKGKGWYVFTLHLPSKKSQHSKTLSDKLGQDARPSEHRPRETRTHATGSPASSSGDRRSLLYAGRTSDGAGGAQQGGQEPGTGWQCPVWLRAARELGTQEDAGSSPTQLP